jgi:dihydrofolate reductase
VTTKGGRRFGARRWPPSPGSISSALDQAREAAGHRAVRIAGGGETIQQYLDTGLVDEYLQVQRLKGVRPVSPGDPLTKDSFT